MNQTKQEFWNAIHENEYSFYGNVTKSQRNPYIKEHKSKVAVKCNHCHILA